MRLARTFVAAACSAFVSLAAQPAAAAPPEGCYGFPDIPDAFLCVTSFTPGNAVPTVGPGGGTSVTIPRFCAGDCYGPITVPIPGASLTPGSGPVLTFVYQGQTYPITVGEVPPVPEVPTVPEIPEVPELPVAPCRSSLNLSVVEVPGIGVQPVGCVQVNTREGSVEGHACAPGFEEYPGCVNVGIGRDDVLSLVDAVTCVLRDSDDSTTIGEMLGCFVTT